MHNLRNVSSEKYRAYCVSPDGISGWSEPGFNKWLPDLSCYGSLARYDDSTILFSNCYSQTGRVNNAVSISYDEGKTFKERKILRYETGGYLDICVDRHHNINVVVEWPDEDGQYSISLYRFNMNWLKK